MYSKLTCHVGENSVHLNRIKVLKEEKWISRINIRMNHKRILKLMDYMNYLRK